MITIRNKHSYHGDGFYVGRPTPLGNPFEIGKDGNREEVIQKYQEWLSEEMDKQGPAMNFFVNLFEELVKTGELNLICWCDPKGCHAEIIRDFLVEAIKEKKESL